MPFCTALGPLPFVPSIPIFLFEYTTSLHAFFTQSDPIQLASFCRALYRLHHPST